MNDAVLDGVLIGQHDDVNKLAEQGVENLGQAEEIADVRSPFDELIRLLVSKLHDSHTVRNLWVKCKV